jgi:hypothetical protein
MRQFGLVWNAPRTVRGSRILSKNIRFTRRQELDRNVVKGAADSQKIFEQSRSVASNHPGWAPLYDRIPGGGGHQRIGSPKGRCTVGVDPTVGGGGHTEGFT